MTLITAVLGCTLSIGSANAQEEPAEDFLAQFNKQLQKTRSVLGKHRGLVMAPIAGEDTKEIEFTPVRPGEEVNIRVGFDFDSDVLRDDQLGKLAPLCDAMTTLADVQFRIIGHTDASGEGGYNDTLSLRRALAVRTHLSSNCGIAGERLQAVGVGERYLVADAAPDAADHRRVEFQAWDGE